MFIDNYLHEGLENNFKTEWNSERIDIILTYI
jgi:hypothetical protein